MKCIYCGEELKTDSLFCSHCGKAVQIVPDYNVYEEDYLKQVLTQENQPQKKPGGTQNKPGDIQKKPGEGGEVRDVQAQKKKQRTIILCVIGIVCVLIFALLILGAAIRTDHANSFDYQVEAAEKAYQKGNIEEAISYYENALSLDNKNLEVRLKLAQIYLEKNDIESAMVLYQEVLREDRKNREACENLIAIYEEKDNMDAIVSLSDSVDESLKDLFVDYIVTTPDFSITEGTYDKAQSLELFSTGNFRIYYTLDGSDPIAKGMMYTTPIELSENDKTYTIRAVCMNDKNIYSEVVSKEFKIEIPAPDMPIVTPDGGDFGVETSVTVTVPDGCSAYYTWDGSTPNAYSQRYYGPLTIPEGNNILSVIIIDDTTNLSSDVYKGNFIYYSDDYTDDAQEDTDTVEE